MKPEKMQSVKTPRELHELWCERKREAGWRYGEKIDVKARTHPCLVTFDDLPKHQMWKPQASLLLARLALKIFA